MSTVGIVAEYNPFHLGHAYQIAEAKKISGAEYVVIVLSGNYVQRGEPAFMDKWSRTRAALSHGADLVLEIPTLFATSSAEHFAAASTNLLAQTGIVDSICFGSESGNIHELQSLATFMNNEPEKYKILLNKYLSEGFKFPTARAKAYTHYFEQENFTASEMTTDLSILLNTPNNILGIEYLKAIDKYQLALKPFTIKRKGANYHEENPDLIFPSATAIRKFLKSDGVNAQLQGMVPDATFESISTYYAQGNSALGWNDFYHHLKYKLLLHTPESLGQIYDVREGLENRILANIGNAHNFEDFIEALSTKRYTKTHLQRILLHVLLDMTEADFSSYYAHHFNGFIKILGFNKSASSLMRQLQKNAKLPVISNVRDAIDRNAKSESGTIFHSQLEQEIRCTNVYNLVRQQKFGITCKNDFTQPLIIV